jgi:hypothetical protein
MTEKENFIRVLNGQEPAWTPRFNMSMTGMALALDPYEKHHAPLVGLNYGVAGGMTRKPDGKGGFVDIFGVTYIPTADTGGMMQPAPNVHILKDIRKWRDVIKLPSIEGYDWEGEAKKALDIVDADLKSKGVDRSMVATIFSAGVEMGFFLNLANFMGMTDALCAFLEEPEAVHELYAYLADFSDILLKNAIKHLKPDVILLGGDTATARNPFMSRKTWQEMIMPYDARQGILARDAGIPVMNHCCGRCEDFIEDWVSFGVGSWNPAQVMNDLDGIKKKYGNNLVLIGGWDTSGPVSQGGADEEMVRQAVRDCIDRYASGGGFMFYADILGSPSEPDYNNRLRWITEEYEAYRDKPYK